MVGIHSRESSTHSDLAEKCDDPNMARYRMALWLSTIAFMVGAVLLVGSLVELSLLGVISALIVVLGSLSLIRGLRLRLGLRRVGRHS
jgi:hypothetical protein